MLPVASIIRVAVTGAARTSVAGRVLRLPRLRLVHDGYPGVPCTASGSTIPIPHPGAPCHSHGHRSAVGPMNKTWRRTRRNTAPIISCHVPSQRASQSSGRPVAGHTRVFLGCGRQLDAPNFAGYRSGPGSHEFLL